MVERWVIIRIVVMYDANVNTDHDIRRSGLPAHHTMWRRTQHKK